MVLFAVLGLTAMQPFYRIQTDIQEIRDMCISYSIVLCVCSFAAFHQIMMERLLAAIGRADLTMVPMLVGAVVNIILDPVMIFGWFGFPAMGITGAGIATVTAQAVAAVAGLLLNLRFNHEVHINGKVFVPDRTVVGEIIKIGIPVALSNCLVAVIALGMNSILMGLSPPAPGIYVIYIRLQSFVIMPSSGMSSAGIYNLIAREEEREMAPFCYSENIAMTPYSALASGRLSRHPGETSKRLEQDAYARFKYDDTAEADRKVIQRVEEIAEKRDVSMMEFSLVWLLTKVTAPVVGATKISHVDGAVKAVELELTEAETRYLEELYVPHALAGVMAQNGKQKAGNVV